MAIANFLTILARMTLVLARRGPRKLTMQLPLERHLFSGNAGIKEGQAADNKANLKLARNVFIPDNLAATPLQRRAAEKLEACDIQLERLNAFCEFTSHIAKAASPILRRQGQLLKVWLNKNIPIMTDASLTETKT